MFYRYQGSGHSLIQTKVIPTASPILKFTVLNVQLPNTLLNKLISKLQKLFPHINEVLSKSQINQLSSIEKKQTMKEILSIIENELNFSPVLAYPYGKEVINAL